MFLLSFCSELKQSQYYIKVLILFLTLKFCESLSSGRGGIIGCLLFTLWYFYKFLKLKINLSRLAIIGLLLVSLCFYISNRRNFDSKQNFKIVGVEKIYDFWMNKVVVFCYWDIILAMKKF